MSQHGPRRIVVVGGVAAGMSAATRLRRNDDALEIVVLERGDHVSFANCGLPYYLGGVIEDREELLLQDPASLAGRFGLDVRVRHEAVHLDPAARTVSVMDRETGETYDLQYDALVLATGATPVLPPLPGIERARTLRDVADVDRLVADVADAGSAVILGGGFIGLELAENLHARGVGVTIVELAGQVLAPLDVEMARPVTDHLVRGGIDVMLGVGAAAIEPDSVVLADGTRLPADVVVAAVGVRPESTLARDAGLVLTERGGIAVDGQQRTSDPHVYAVGDVAAKQDAVVGGAVLVPLAQTANRHGRLVADVITGRDVRALPVLGTAVVRVLGLTVATTGWSERRLRAVGRDVRAIHTHPESHAGYYPGAQPMSLKLVVDPATDAILGAQAVGGEGVDKRIDVIATAMRAGLTASDLADLELAYAPQVGSAKDAVNQLGMVADNLRTGTERTTQWYEVAAEQARGVTVLDVRTDKERAEGAIPGSVHIPVDELRGRLDEVPAGEVLVCCAVGKRGHVASRLLAQRGHDVRNLDGGVATWCAATC